MVLTPVISLKEAVLRRSNSGYQPFYAFRPEALGRAVSFFLDYFDGLSVYAVKTNPDETVLRHVYKHGIRNFDVASLEEVRLVHNLFPNASLYFMHPIKSRIAIREAYFSYGVRRFSLDCHEELKKILEETNNAKDLELFVRLSIPNTYAELGLADKFGVGLGEAVDLLKKVAKHSAKLGVCFHVGSQCMHPDAYRIAIRMSKEIISQAKVRVDYFNVGGGFPSIYPGMIPPHMVEYFDAIHEEFSSIPGHERMTLLAEPGRAIVAESMSLVTQVVLRKGNMLYINDGTYGGLFDAGTPKFIFPVQLIRGAGDEQKDASSDLVPYSFYGPTCDSLDFMKGPFYLPSCVDEGDYIEFGQMGAYGRSLASRFNGFVAEESMVMISDEPLMTMYQPTHISKNQLEVIAA